MLILQPTTTRAHTRRIGLSSDCRNSQARRRLSPPADPTSHGVFTTPASKSLAVRRMLSMRNVDLHVFRYFGPSVESKTDVPREPGHFGFLTPLGHRVNFTHRAFAGSRACELTEIDMV